MKRLATAILAISAIAPATAVAQPDPWPTPNLTAGEAARMVGWALHQEFTNLQRGSLTSRCRRVRRNVRFCQYTYFDQAGNCWWGDMWVRETRTRYLYRITYDARCH
jgi:hypothetical protein